MFTATRIIGIDMGHRVTYHGSKCRNLHGHRYTIEATVGAEELHVSGEEQGMVMDFGFLKKAMMDTIDEYCDHGMVLWIEDPLVPILYPEIVQLIDWKNADQVQFFPQGTSATGKLVLTPFVPTAENLAKWWFELLQTATPVGISMISVKVWETPNCYSVYP